VAKIDKPNVYVAPAQLEAKEFESVRSRLAYDYGYGVALVPWTLDEWLKHKRDLAEYEICVCKRRLAHKELTAIASAAKRARLAALTPDQRGTLAREEEARERLVTRYRACAKEDHRTTVLALHSIWAEHPVARDGGQCWPSKSDFIHKGPERILRSPRVGQRLPLPRDFGLSKYPTYWGLRLSIMQQELDVVNPHFCDHGESLRLGAYGSELNLCLNKDLHLAMSEDF